MGPSGTDIGLRIEELQDQIHRTLFVVSWVVAATAVAGDKSNRFFFIYSTLFYLFLLVKRIISNQCKTALYSQTIVLIRSHITNNPNDTSLMLRLDANASFWRGIRHMGGISLTGIEEICPKNKVIGLLSQKRKTV